MPKDPIRQKENQHKWYLKNKEIVRYRGRINNKKYKRRNIYFVDRVKAKGCVVCGYNKCIRAIDFHHLKNKKFSISEVARQRYSIKVLKEEIRKCIRVCANCRREIHAGIIKL